MPPSPMVVDAETLPAIHRRRRQPSSSSPKGVFFVISSHSGSKQRSFLASRNYVVSTPIIAYYDTVIIGDARIPPTLTATAGFSGIAVIDADPYVSGGANWYVNQDNLCVCVSLFRR